MTAPFVSPMSPPPPTSVTSGNTVYKRLDAEDIVRANPTEVTTGIWTGDSGSITTFYTSSVQSASLSSQYYYDVYNINPTSSLAEVQFSVAYGHISGGGAPTLTQSDTATLSTQVIYSQYRNMLLDGTDTKFTFNGNYDSNHIFVINLARARLRERLDPGNFILYLSGSGGLRTFIDDSGQTLSAGTGKGGQVFNLVSGSLTGVSGSTVVSASSATQGGFGLVYPDLGFIVLNPDALREVGALTATPTTSSALMHNYNHQILFNSMVKGADFQARSAETISSTHYFVRLRNQEFNYSNNPTFFDETNGSIENNEFVQNPVVYVTSIGFYNDQNELLAVAKLSKPVKKTFDSETLIRARLDW
jgi:hypothetical protein